MPTALTSCAVDNEHNKLYHEDHSRASQQQSMNEAPIIPRHGVPWVGLNSLEL